MELIEDTVLGQIKKLEEKAAEVLRLKKDSRPRRPIVIEFCGSPKSGKDQLHISPKHFSETEQLQNIIANRESKHLPHS